MSKRRFSDHAQKKGRSQLATLATYALATLPILPALKLNIEQSAGKSAGWLLAAIVFIGLASAAMEAARHADGSLRWGLVLLGSFFMCINILNALANATNDSDHRSDHRRAIIAAASERENQVAAGRRRRAELAKIAGEVPPATLEAEIAALKAANAGRWRATDECTPDKIKSQEAKAFCAELAKLASKLASARERDKIDSTLSTLAGKTEAAEETPDTADPQADSIAAPLGILRGKPISQEGKRVIRALINWSYALAAEVAAATGPMIVLALIGLIRRRREPTCRTMSEKSRTISVDTERPAPSPVDSPVFAFIATHFVRKRGAIMPADQPWQMWLAHCAELGIQAGSQRAFGIAMKACHSWERNNNRPRYVNVAPRAGAPMSGPALSLVNA